MKTSLTALLLVPLVVLVGCASDDDPICVLNDADCDGVPDDLGTAVDRDGKPGPDPFDIDGDGVADGWAVDTDGDGEPDALGLDTTGDGYVDSIDTNLDGIADKTTGKGDVGGGGNGSGGTTTTPDLPIGTWNAPVVAAAQANLPGSYGQYEKWRREYVNDCGDGRSSVVTKGSPAAVVSEGIGYGMLITANMGTQAEFDAIHNFYIGATKSPGGLMAWQCHDACGNCPSDNSASDADLDAAMALIQAESRFGGGTYLAAAQSLIAKLRTAVVKTCSNGRYAIIPGEWDPQCENLNPSYHSPGYYRVFAQVDTGGTAIWTKMVDDAYLYLDESKSQGSNGLWPDGTGGSCFSCNGYDACRVPWRIATDFAWSGDPRAKALLEYAAGKVSATGMPGLSMGNPNSAFYGSFALTGLGVSQAQADSFYTQWQSETLQDNAYYQGTLSVIYHLLAAGQFPSTL